VYNHTCTKVKKACTEIIPSISLLPFNLLYEVGYIFVFESTCTYDVVVKKFTFAISSPDEFLVIIFIGNTPSNLETEVFKFNF